jgi:hypothetical protein
MSKISTGEFDADHRVPPPMETSALDCPLVPDSPLSIDSTHDSSHKTTDQPVDGPSSPNTIPADQKSPKDGTGASKPYPWILHPAIDLMTCCGGLMALFAGLWLVCNRMFHSPIPYLAEFALASFIVLNMPHGWASYVRVFNSEHSRKAMGGIVIGLGVVCVLLSGFALVSPLGYSIVGRILYIFSAQHFFSQSYGIALLYCYKRQFYFSKWQQKIFWLLIQAAIIDGAIITLSVKGQKVLTKPIDDLYLPAWVGQTSHTAVFVLAGAFAGVLLYKWLKERKIFPYPAFLCMTSTFMMQGYLPMIVNDPVFASALLAPNLHLTQYVTVTTAFHLKETGLPEGVSFSKIYTQLCSSVALKYFLFLLGAGWLTSIIVIPTLWKCIAAFGFDIEMVAAVVFCGLNLHHYWTDATIWKQRDPYIRKLLVA